MTPRKAAVLSLNSSIKNGKFVNLELDSAIKKYGFEGKDKAFYTALLYGTVERKITLDYIISRLSSVEMSKIQPLVMCILETGLYQVFYMDKVPDSAACNEATELVKCTCPKAYAGFVNAVMRNAVRKKTEILSQIENLKGSFGISVKYSVPEWLVKMWDEDFGCAESIVKALCDRIPYTPLRINTLKISADEYLSKIDKSIKASKVYDGLVTVSGSCNVKEMHGYDDGLFFVQDMSSYLTASLINKESVKAENPIIVDTCACPGGKTFSSCINLEDKCTVYSFDLHQNRLKLINDSAKRLGLENIKTMALDARCPEKSLFGKADAVICDVPCSGLGIIAKKPDIRYKKYEEIERLPEIQKSILCESSKYVKKGGFIIYSTCTLRNAENIDVVNEFLKDNKDFSLCKTGLLGDDTGMYTFLPHITGTDGFFVAKLVKN